MYKGYGAAGTSPEEAMETLQGLEPLCSGGTDRVEVVQPGGVSRGTLEPLPVPKELQESWRETLDKGLECQDKGEWLHTARGQEMTAVTAANVNFKWDPKSLEIRTLAVERLLEPLVTQVTTLVNTSNKGPSNKKRGRSKKAHVLAASVEQATENFLEKGDKIAKESQFLKEELVAAVEDVRKQGDLMKSASGEFADDPCSSVKRGNMVRAARALLSAVTRLLILADMADVYKLLVQLKVVEDGILKLRNAGTEQDLGIQYKALKPEVDKLNIMAAKRQQKQIIVDPSTFSEERFRPSLEERLESIISGAALMADSSCTRDDRRERIVAECNAVRQALQDLLSEYMGNIYLENPPHMAQESSGMRISACDMTVTGR
ncbi:hypothetical protein BTVI_44605 [Pitangus sulphuratus]|nr:hypothetical protein BTVI_44605 [Pitangus sulphuratus]